MIRRGCITVGWAKAYRIGSCPIRYAVPTLSGLAAEQHFTARSDCVGTTYPTGVTRRSGMSSPTLRTGRGRSEEHN
jgi:hypothetical protein